eukprot:TRINITY_DN1028_c0_g1_i2.p4 TRINITY_DN1028_c0_g1~~TRINITY_DN1028_c0_g1_i2.p4  ORF type:complete len:109 (-),score=3.08 TRINITY_DN1028_c0_g1_i2:554-880(-)
MTDKPPTQSKEGPGGQEAMIHAKETADIHTIPKEEHRGKYKPHTGLGEPKPQEIHSAEHRGKYKPHTKEGGLGHQIFLNHFSLRFVFFFHLRGTNCKRQLGFCMDYLQ